MSLEAAMLGHGLIFESELLAQDYLRSGKLVRVLSEQESLPVSARHLVLPRIAHFLNWIQKELKA